MFKFAKCIVFKTNYFYCVIDLLIVAFALCLIFLNFFRRKEQMVCNDIDREVSMLLNELFPMEVCM